MKPFLMNIQNSWSDGAKKGHQSFAQMWVQPLPCSCSLSPLVFAG